MAMALAFATLIGGFSISPALARDDGHDRGRHNGDHGDHGDRGRRDYHRYEQPVYVPPPVYYEPRQSPGISFFFPLDLRR
jgi:hypothetical protein